MFDEVYVELFKFDAEVDYTPYYKKYTVEYSGSDTLLDLLNKVNSIEKFDYRNSNDFNIQINNIYFNVKELIINVINLVSTTFIIEPVSKFRAVNDLIIDNRDYLEKIELFSKFLTLEEKTTYANKYELEYYASTTYEINKDYIGDHVILIANDIIKKDPESNEEIMNIISDKDDGAIYHTSLENKIYNYNMEQEKIIQNIVATIPNAFKRDYYIADVKLPDEIQQYFENFNIASFDGLDKKSYGDIIIDAKANYIDLRLKNEDLATASFSINSDFSLKIVGKILLEAKDKSADFLIVRGVEDLALFDEKQKKVEKLIGREIGLPIISREQFSNILSGEKDRTLLGIDKHKVEVTFL